MIIPEKDLHHTQDSTLMVEQKPALDTKRTAEDDLPPAYHEQVHDVSSGATSSSATAVPTRPWQGVKPTNMFSIVQRDSSIRGNYVLDPRLRIPLSLLPEQTEEGRKNLSFQTRDGTIDVGVWLVGNERGVDAKARMERTTMRMHSTDGQITVRLDTSPAHEPFLLDVYSRDGRVTVHLPRSFHGAVSLKTRDGKREMSEGLRANSTALGTAECTTRYFIGELPHVDDGGWEGDELRMETRDGRIKVQYIDEMEPQGSKGRFFSRVFSG